MADPAPAQVVAIERIEQRIYLIRGQKVMLDSDLAPLYGVRTSRLNEAVKRNSDRFPKDFMFQLTDDELEAMNSSQIGEGLRISVDRIAVAGDGGTHANERSGPKVK